ncbi:MAG TPA: hypothetical protein VE644_03910 [Gaiellaceae bacterium]|nr:hypothetical protein [Gaiellaceae bacterium]
MLSAIVTALDLVDDGELSRFARLYGGSIQRLVESALQFFDRAIHQRIVALDLSTEEKDILIDEKGASVIDLVNRLVPWLQRRLREHALLEYIVTTTESYMDERAARIADYASPHEVLVSEETKRSAELANVSFEPVGDVALKGVSGAVTLHRAMRI